jgi:hypothetical protein
MRKVTLKNAVLSLGFAVAMLFSASSSMAASGSRVLCKCYHSQQTLWPDGAAYRWVPGCASGRGSSPQCLGEMETKRAALKGQCKSLISVNCPQEPKCLEAAEEVRAAMVEVGSFENFTRPLDLVTQEAGLEVFVGQFYDYTIVPGSKNGKVQKDPVTGKDLVVLTEKTVTFKPDSAGACGIPTVTSKVLPSAN